MKNFFQVTNLLYRSSAPSIKDILFLNEKYGITRIISLDEESGKKINRACKLLNINHVNLFVDFSRQSLINFVQNIFNLFKSNEKTLIHCKLGCDRTGLAIAFYRCKFEKWKPEEAIKEAKYFGLGTGINFKLVKLYEKLIMSCNQEDVNNSDIVSNEREYLEDEHSSPLNHADSKTFAPYFDQTKQYPFDNVWTYNYDYRNAYEPQENTTVNRVPLVGIYNNVPGMNGSGIFETGLGPQ